MSRQRWEKDPQLPSAHLMYLRSCTSSRAADDDSLFALRVSDHTAVPALHSDLSEADPFPAWCAGLGTDHLEGGRGQWGSTKPNSTSFICGSKLTEQPDSSQTRSSHMTGEVKTSPQVTSWRFSPFWRQICVGGFCPSVAPVELQARPQSHQTGTKPTSDLRTHLLNKTD